MVSNGETVSNIMLSSLVVLIAAGKTSLPGLLWQLPADPVSDIWLVLYSWKTRGRWVNELVHLFTHFETSYQSCQPSKDTNILLYHVVPGFVEARELKDGFIKTAQGQEIEVDINSGRVFLNEDTNVINTNVLASNGIIHVIDKVLLPPAPPQNLVATASADSSFSTLVELVAAAGLVDTLQDGEFTG